MFLRHEKPHALGPIDHGCCLLPWWLQLQRCRIPQAFQVSAALALVTVSASMPAPAANYTLPQTGIVTGSPAPIVGAPAPVVECIQAAPTFKIALVTVTVTGVDMNRVVTASGWLQRSCAGWNACGLRSHLPHGDRPVCVRVRHSSGGSVNRRSHDHQV